MDACSRIKQLAHAVSATSTPEALVQQVEAFAERYFADDVATNKVGPLCTQLAAVRQETPFINRLLACMAQRRCWLLLIQTRPSAS